MQVKPYQIESFINNIASNKEIFAALVYGPESGLASIRFKKIARAIVPDLSDAFLVANLDAKQLEEDKGRLADEFGAISMIGGRKVILVNGNNKISDSLKMVFEGNKKDKNFKPIGDNFIVILAGDLDKSSSLRKFATNCPYIATIACYEDDEATIANIIRQQFKENNLTFDNEVINLMINKFGKNRQIILNEIDKLILFIGKQNHITAEILQKSISDIAEISAFELVQSFANRDLAKSILFLEKLFAEKTAPIMILRFLNSYFNKLSAAKNNIENGSNLALEMKIQNIFFKQQNAFRKHLDLWNKKAINDMITKLQELEIKCKNSNFDANLLLSSFINFALIRKYDKK